MVTLSGKWELKAIGNDAGWRQRIVISGSAASDGPYEMVLGTTVANVEGGPFEITAQAFNPGSSVWIDSLIQSAMNWDNATGLQVQINIDDNPPHGDLDFNDLVVLCTAQDAQLSSPLAGPRPDLTIPEKYLRGTWQPEGPGIPEPPQKPPRKVAGRKRPKK